MTFRTLIRRSLRFHLRSHVGTVLGAAVASAVLIGALVVGDSVRGSLRDRALARLGKVHFALSSGDRLFQRNLVDRLSTDSMRFGVRLDAATPRVVLSSATGQMATALQLPGVASRQDGSARANRVNVFGVDPEWWALLAGWHEPTNGVPMRPPDRKTIPTYWEFGTETNQPSGLLTRWAAGEVVLINETLAQQLHAREGDEIVLRVRKPTALTQDAVVTPRDEAAVAFRFKVGRVLSAAFLGDFSLTANQAPPPNAFVPRDALAAKLDLEGKANLLVHTALLAQRQFSRLDPRRSKLSEFVPSRLTWGQRKLLPLDRWIRRWRPQGLGIVPVLFFEDASPAEALTQLSAELAGAWSLDDAQLSARAVEAPQTATGGEYVQPFVELASPRIFLDPPVTAAALKPRTRLLTDRDKYRSDGTNDLAFAQLVTNGVGVLTYLVNRIETGTNAAPYSMITAAGLPYMPPDLRDDEIVVNDWLAADLKVKPGDPIRLTYFDPDSGARLVERTNSFRVHSIVPMKGVHADRTLMPEFPGLSKAESTHDWDAGFPLVHKIRDQDEGYWKQYRGTPKAFVTLAAGQKMWANRFGNLTAIRYAVPTNSFSSVVRDAVERNLLANLDPASVGLRFEPVREQALQAVAQSQDFGGLFLGFSFFLIAAALLLMSLLFQFSIEQRATDVGTLLALGFTPRQVRRLLLLEGGALAVLGSALGLIGGVGYARALLQGLATIWREAVAASALDFHAVPATLLAGFASAVVVAGVTIWLALRQQARQPARELLTGEADSRSQIANLKFSSRGVWIGVIAGLGALVLVATALGRGRTSSAGTFFSAGALLLVSGMAFCSLLLRRLGTSASAASWTLSSMGVRSVTRRPKRSLATLGLLACGSFLIASIGVFRLDPVRDAGKRSSGTGGFALLGETTLPVVQDLNTARGRDFFALDAPALHGVEFVPFRVRDGDEASCLNLNRAQKPRLLGVKPELLEGRFTFAQVAKGEPRVTDPWERLLARSEIQNLKSGMEIPAIGDAASIQWAMGKKVGDTLDYVDERGRSFKLRIVGAVANSILQGNLLIEEEAFVRLFPSEAGHRMFLIDAPSKESAQVSETLSRALRDVGLELTPTTRRLAQFNAVQNTYLGTFQVLGGLGLLLGSVGLGVVVLRNVLERRGELALLLAVGFRPRAVEWLVMSEHAALLLAGLGVGVLAAFVAVVPAAASPGGELPYGSLAATLGGVLISGVGWTWLATRLALRGELLKALRNE